MKLSGIFALAHLTSAASMTNNRHRMVARLVNGQHDECSAFMRRNADNFEFNINLNRATLQKRHCPAESVTYDSNFCTLVCELQEGQACVVDSNIGDDVCASGLICQQGHHGQRHGTCQPMFDYADDIFADDSSFDILNFLDMIDL